MGRLKRRNQAGYILLDVLVAVFIVLVGFTVVLGGMSLTWSLAVKQNARVQSMIQQRNTDAKDHSVVFQKE
jgi:Tfp pilus assembly protein PilV